MTETLPPCPDCTYADVQEVWQAEPVEVLSIPCAKHDRFRDAATGRYTTEADARERPGQTIREDDTRVRELTQRVHELETELREAEDDAHRYWQRIQWMQGQEYPHTLHDYRETDPENCPGCWTGVACPECGLRPVRLDGEGGPR